VAGVSPSPHHQPSTPEAELSSPPYTGACFSVLPTMDKIASLPLISMGLAALIGYIIGSLSFAVIVSRLFGLDDPRNYGSGNPGATNVLRSGNKAAAILTLVFDALKAYVPVLLARQLGHDDYTVIAVALGAFLGHLWPVFFKFEGGKGVATAAGALLALNPAMGGIVLGVWLAMAAIFRYSSLAALTAALAAPLVETYLSGWGPTAMGVVVMSALLIWRHDANIRKLLTGQESKLGQKSNTPV
jgi:glycerol-3-phosphate acyltransferase PlsY